MSDVVQEDGIWAIKIRQNSIRGVNNDQTTRDLPVPTELIRPGFVEYAQRLKHLGHSALFPELISPTSKADPGGASTSCSYLDESG